MNCCDSFRRRKVENWAATSCRPGAVLSLPTISFELHAKVTEEIDLEMCSHGQLSEVQMLRDLDVDLGLGQGHISIHSTCSTTSTPNHLTVASRTTEIWPFQCCELSNNLQSLNSRASFPRKKVENRSQTSCSPGPILSLTNISFVLHPKMAEKTDLEMCSYGQLWEVQMLRDLDRGSGQGTQYM